MSDSLHIDGSHGEGGGQIVRSALALSLVTGRSVAISNIRAGREKPGLMRQHLTAVNAAVEISGAAVTGAAVGSRALTFEPRPVRAGNYQFSVGTAGSATLVLQTILPALLLADGPSTLILEGGTHNPWAPPFDFLQQAYLPLVNRMGPHVEVELERHGFFPAGGGRFRVHIRPARSLAGFDLCERGEVVSRQARILISNLPEHIARRERETICNKLGWNENDCAIETIRSAGPGNAVLLTVGCDHATEVFSSIGQQGVKAEQVAGDAVKQARNYLEAGAPVGPYLADQLLLPLGISAWQSESPPEAPLESRLQAALPDSIQDEGGGDSVLQGARPPLSPLPEGASTGRTAGGSYRTLPLTRHSTTHIELLREFLGVTIEVDESAGCRVKISPPAPPLG